jgi:hypothetical protein
MATLEIASLIGHVIAALSVGWLVIASYRCVRRRSEVLGVIVAIAILGRISIGLALFWISYLELPIAQSLQTGGGFWQPALDSAGYYQLAARAADSHMLFSLNYPGPSPFFLNTLAVWMVAVGVSPAAAMFLNLCLYTALVVTVISAFNPANDSRRDWPCIVAIGAYSFSPAIVIHSTQPLKDELSSALLAMVCLGVLALRRLTHRPLAMQHQSGVITGAILVSVGIFGLAGIRWYYAFIIWCALACTLATFAVRGRTAPLPAYAAKSFAVLLAAWLAFGIGAGQYRAVGPDLDRTSIVAVVRAVVEIPFSLLARASEARTGFVTSGGATRTYAPTARLHTVREHAAAVATGLAFLFVPVSLISAASSFDVGGGRGLLSIVDLDTVFLDVTSLVVLLLLWRQRHVIGDRLPLVIFGLILSAATAILLGYVVTNYGTLWRMRSLFAVPLWLLTVALSPRAEQPREISDRQPI